MPLRDEPRRQPLPQFDHQAFIRCVIGPSRDVVDKHRKAAGAAYWAIRAGLNDLIIAARSLFAVGEIASDADDLIAPLAALPYNLRKHLEKGEGWAAAEVLRFLTLAVYEREQTLWAEAAPPGAPFHSQGVGLQALAKAIEWLVGYIHNHALGVPSRLAARDLKLTAAKGLHRASQISLHRSEVEDPDPVHTFTRWTGCVCLTVLQGVYTSSGGIIHFTDLFAEDLATTAPRTFHEIGHLMFELRGWGKRDVSEMSDLVHRYVQGTGAAEGPVRRVMEESYAHWVEYTLFGGDPQLLVRTMWQTWYTSAYGARHPLDALQRTATVYLIDALARHELRRSAIQAGEPIELPRRTAKQLVRDAVTTTLRQVREPWPFGVHYPPIPGPWASHLATHPEQFRELMQRGIEQIVLPFLQKAMVVDWEVEQNLADLVNEEKPDLGGYTCSDEGMVAQQFRDQHAALLEGRVVGPLLKPVKHVLEAQKLVTQAATRLDAHVDVDGHRYYPAQVDMALLLSLASMWDQNSTYPSFVRPSNGGERGDA
jgi:hypothetical protein